MKTLLLVAISLVACGGGDTCTIDTSYDPPIDPARFVATVDNPLFPLIPGTRWVYMGSEERVEVTVTADTKLVAGVTAIVVHDIGRVGDEVIEDTFDYFAQDDAGNVWYLGEDTRELEGGQVVSTAGSWVAGVDGAKPGIVIPAGPIVGSPYRQEYLACEAEDMGKVLATNQTVTLGSGTLTGCLQTEDTTPLEPAVLEHKFYCPGVGLALTIDLATGDREELVEMTP